MASEPLPSRAHPDLLIVLSHTAKSVVTAPAKLGITSVAVGPWTTPFCYKNLNSTLHLSHHYPVAPAAFRIRSLIDMVL